MVCGISFILIKLFFGQPLILFIVVVFASLLFLLAYVFSWVNCFFVFEPDMNYFRVLDWMHLKALDDLLSARGRQCFMHLVGVFIANLSSFDGQAYEVDLLCVLGDWVRFFHCEA